MSEALCPYVGADLITQRLNWATRAITDGHFDLPTSQQVAACYTIASRIPSPISRLSAYSMCKTRRGSPLRAFDDEWIRRGRIAIIPLAANGIPLHWKPQRFHDLSVGQDST